MSRLFVNGAFLGQRITGQQRYAVEVAQRLRALPDVELVGANSYGCLG